jgi:hypothetical protein
MAGEQQYNSKSSDEPLGHRVMATPADGAVLLVGHCLQLGHIRRLRGLVPAQGRHAPQPEALRPRITTALLFSYEEFGFELLVYKFFLFCPYMQFR